MSVEAAPDSELRDLVAQALENNGLLSKLRAELRASVFLTLEENEKFQSKKFTNEKFKKFANTTEGCLVLSLVWDFLDFFGLEFTLSVFKPEAGFGKDFEFEDRNQIISKLNLEKDDDDKKPLISQAIKLLISSSKSKESFSHSENNVSELHSSNVFIKNYRDTNNCNENGVIEEAPERLVGETQSVNGNLASFDELNSNALKDSKISNMSRNLTDFSLSRLNIRMTKTSQVLGEKDAQIISHFNTTKQNPQPYSVLDNIHQSKNLSQNMKSLSINVKNSLQEDIEREFMPSNGSLKSVPLLCTDKNNDNCLHSLHSHTYSGSEIEEEILPGDPSNDSLSVGDDDALDDGSPFKNVDSIDLMKN